MKTTPAKEYDYVRVRAGADCTGANPTTVSIKVELYMRIIRRTRLSPKALNKVIRGLVREVIPTNPLNLSGAVRERLLEKVGGL